MAGTDHLEDLAQTMRRQFELDSLPLPWSVPGEASGPVRLLEVLHRASGGQIPDHAVVAVDEEGGLTTLHFLLPGSLGRVSVASVLLPTCRAPWITTMQVSASASSTADIAWRVTWRAIAHT